MNLIPRLPQRRGEAWWQQGAWGQAAVAAQRLAANLEDDKALEVTAATSTRASAPWWPQGSQRCAMVAIG
jgi:hypothetical protein